MTLPLPVANAQNGCHAPPGTSAIEQYCEKLPAATGEEPTEAGARSAVDRRTTNRLRRAGPDGVGVLSLPSGAPTRDGTGQDRGASEPPSENPLKAVGSGVESGASAGGSFVWLLLAVALGLGALGWMRSRRDSGG